MNTNTSDFKKASARAQANANASGQTRWLHMWNGTFWISNTSVHNDNVWAFDPEPKEASDA